MPEPLPDSDADGIPDHLDPFPLQAPSYTGPGSPTWVRVERAWTVLEGRDVPDTVVAGHDLVLRGQGLGAGAGGEWVIFETRLGKVAVQPAILDSTTWRVKTPPLALAVHVVIGNLRSENHALFYVEPGGPVLFPPHMAAWAGSTLTVEGLNLEDARSLALGSVVLPVEASGPGFVRVTLPAASNGNMLRVVTDSRESNPVVLDFRRTVTVTLDPGLPLASDDLARVNVDGRRVFLAPGATLSLAVPADRASWRRLDLVRASGEVMYGALAVVFWPDGLHSSVSLDSTIAAEILGLWPMLASGGGDDWHVQRARIRLALALPEARDFRDALARLLLSGTTFQRHELRALLLAAMDQSALDRAALAPTALMAMPGEASLFQAFATMDGGPSLGTGAGLNTRHLDDLKIGVVGVGSTSSPDTPRASYSQYTVQRASECVTLGLPTGVAPSDICVDNGTVLPSSAAVYVPRRFNAAPYTPAVGDLRRSHIGGVTDARRFGKDTVILTDDAGQGLCGMRTCYVEIITTGVGLGAQGVSLTANERRIVENLRTRWVLDTYVVPMVTNVLELDNVAGADCLFNAFVQDQVGLGKAVTDFFIAARQTPSLAIQKFDETVGKYLDDTLQEAANIQTADKVLACALAELPDINDVRNRIGQKFTAVDRVLGRLQLFKTVVEVTMGIGGVLFTPEKMLFRVAPRAEITDLTPKVLDLNDVYRSDGSDRPFTLTGDWLANTVEHGFADAFLPRLVFRDRRMAERDFEVRPEHVVLRADPRREIVLSLPHLAFFNPDVPVRGASLSGLEAGPLEMWLEYQHPDFSNYPGGKLRVPSVLPITLVTPPRITGFDPPGAGPGAGIVASGNGLARYGARPRVVLLRNTVLREYWSGEPIPAEIRDGKLVFTLPACDGPSGCVPVGEWLVELNDGTGELAQVVISERAFSTGPNRVTPYVKLGDFSSNDDVMQLKLLDANRNVMQERRLPDVIGERFITLLVNDPDFLRFASVTCVDPGADSTCTYDLVGGFLAFIVGPSFVAGHSGQLQAGETVVFPVEIPPE